MQDSPIFTVLLPVALVIIMFGLGLSLTTGNFRDVLKTPKALVVGLILQIVVMPAICFGMVYLFGLEPALAVGMMMLAASPGGTSSNLYSLLAGGDVALNIVLTALNSALAIVTMPLIINFSLAHFYGEGQAISLPFNKVLQIFVVVLIPMLLGLWLRRRSPGLADRAAKPVKTLSALFLIAVVIIALVKEWETLKVWAPVVGFVTLSFNIVSLAIGYFGPRALGIGRPQAIATSMEIGIHNAALAIAIALSPLLLNNPTMAIPAAIYGLIAYLTAACFVYLLKRWNAGIAASPVGKEAVTGHR